MALAGSNPHTESVKGTLGGQARRRPGIAVNCPKCGALRRQLRARTECRGQFCVVHTRRRHPRHLASRAPGSALRLLPGLSNTVEYFAARGIPVLRCIRSCPLLLEFSSNQISMPIRTLEVFVLEDAIPQLTHIVDFGIGGQFIEAGRWCERGMRHPGNVVPRGWKTSQKLAQEARVPRLRR